MTKKLNDAEACEFVTRGNPLGATTGRSQASAPLCTSPPLKASDVAALVRPQGIKPAQPAHAAGGTVAQSSPIRPGGVQQATSSSLDTLDITRPARYTTLTHETWVQALEAPTKEHRQKRANELASKAKRKRAELRNAGASEPVVASETKWLNDREKAQRERIPRVLACGTEVLAIICQDCGTVHERSAGCRCGLICFRCRATIAAEKRGKFLAACSALMLEARKKGLLSEFRRGGAYGEKFLTLTVPHLKNDTIHGRIERLLLAWPKLLKILNRYFRERRIASVEWFRVIEWTPGQADQLGNPHLHLWLFSPFLDQAIIKAFWREALLASGCPPEFCRNPIVHIVAMHDRRGGAQELIKYLTKDICANGHKLPPEIYAQVFMALDGHRQTQASRGFMARAKRAAPACDCGSTLPKRVRRKVLGAASPPPVGSDLPNA